MLRICIVYRVICNNKWRTLVTDLHVAIHKHYIPPDSQEFDQCSCSLDFRLDDILIDDAFNDSDGKFCANHILRTSGLSLDN